MELARYINFVCVFLCVLIIGCDNQVITTIKLPKQQLVVAQLQKNPADFSWQIPDLWVEADYNEFRKGSYNVPDVKGSSNVADFSIVSFPGDAGGLLQNVTRWRGQLMLASISEAVLQEELIHLDINQLHADIVFIKGNKIDESIGETKSTLAAVIDVQSETFFFKLTGPGSIVLNEYDRFIGVLESFK